jgi:hypothetical protein
MNQRQRGVAARRPGRRIAVIRMPADSTRRQMDRPRTGSMIDGEFRNAEWPQAPQSSSIIHAVPAEPVPYIGSLRASDWSLHGGRLGSPLIR